MAKLKVLKRQGNYFNEEKFVMTMIKYYSLNHIYSILDKNLHKFCYFSALKKNSNFQKELKRISK